jgi:hypothetical protein
VQQLLRTCEDIWQGLAGWSQIDPDQQHRLIGAIERAYAGQTEKIRRARDRRLAAMLQGLESARNV